MKETKTVTCIVCPTGCHLTVTLDGKTVLSVEGMGCPRGKVYGAAEAVAPVRVLTTSLPVDPSFGGGMLPVKSARPLPKERLFDAMRALSRVTIGRPLALGDVVVPNICGTGVDMVACAELPEKKESSPSRANLRA